MSGNRRRVWFALFAFVLAQGGALDARRAQGDGVVLLWSSLPGVARGQTLRVTVGNLLSIEARAEHLDVTAIVSLFDTEGRQVARAESAAIGSGELARFDFERGSIPAPGDAGTGRLQLRAEIEVRTGVANKIDALTLKQKVAQHFPVSTEVFGTATGRTAATVKTYSIVDAWPAVVPAGPVQQPMTLGIAPGERVRYTLFLADGTPVRDEAPLRFVVSDDFGRVLFASPYVRWPNGSSHVFEVGRDALSIPGEPGTGRVQVRVQLEADPEAAPAADGRILQGALELIDAASGETRTVASHPDFLWWPSGKTPG